MNSTIKFCILYILLIVLCPVVFISCEQKSDKTFEIRGIYGNPKPFWDKDISLNTLGVNAIFVHSGSINHDMVNRAKSEGLLVFAEFATLNGKNYVEEHPEAWAINEKGEKCKPHPGLWGFVPLNLAFVSTVLTSCGIYY